MLLTVTPSTSKVKVSMVGNAFLVKGSVIGPTLYIILESEFILETSIQAQHDI